MRRSRSLVTLSIVTMLSGLLGVAQSSPASADAVEWFEVTSSASVALDSQYLSTDATGQHLLMTNWTKGLRVSANSGSDWTTLPGSSSTDSPPMSGWGWTRASDDGTTAYVNRYVSGAAILSRLTVSGWTDLTTPAHGSIWTFDTSATGAVVVASDDGYGLLKSVDSGATWLPIAGSPVAASGWGDVRISGDASRIGALSGAGVLSTSADRGVTWNSRNILPVLPPGGWWGGLTMSDSGLYMTAVFFGDTVADSCVYTSSDGGTTWTRVAALNGLALWSVDASNSGARIIATSRGASGHVFMSLDGGLNWSQSTAPTANWQGGVVSGNGGYMYAQIRDGAVYRLALGPELTPLAPAKPVASKVRFPSAGAARISWAAATDNGSPLLRYDYCLAKCEKRSSWKSNQLRTSITVKHLARGHKYTVRIRAVNAVGRSAVTRIRFTQHK